MGGGGRVGCLPKLTSAESDISLTLVYAVLLVFMQPASHRFHKHLCDPAVCQALGLGAKDTWRTKLHLALMC